MGLGQRFSLLLSVTMYVPAFLIASAGSGGKSWENLGVRH